MKARTLFVAIMCLCTAIDGYGRTITVDANITGKQAGSVSIAARLCRYNVLIMHF